MIKKLEKADIQPESSTIIVKRRPPLIPRVIVALPGLVREAADGSQTLNIVTTPVPKKWEQPQTGILGKFGVRASVLEEEILNRYKEPAKNIYEVTATFEFGDYGLPRVFSLEQFPGRRWLDLRTMKKGPPEVPDLSVLISEKLGLKEEKDEFSSWGITSGKLSAKAEQFLSPAAFEKHIDEIEKAIGPLDVIIFPVDAQNRRAPLYAWIRRINCMTNIECRHLNLSGESISFDPSIKWAD